MDIFLEFPFAVECQLEDHWDDIFSSICIYGEKDGCHHSIDTFHRDFAPTIVTGKQQTDILKKCELPFESFKELKEYCDLKNV